MSKSKRDKIFDTIIRYAFIILFVINVSISLLLVNSQWFADNYNYNYDNLSIYFGSSVYVSILFLVITYRVRLCLYNKIVNWAFLCESLINLFAINFIPQEYYAEFSYFYVNFMLYPTAILAVNYLIIEERKQKRKS